MHPSSILIGVVGDSCTGKTRLCTLIQALFGADNVLFFPGDNYHVAERHDALWNRTTHLDPEANLLDEYARDLAALKKGKAIERREYLHHTGKFGDMKTYAPKPVILAEGLHTLYTPPLRSLVDIAVFLEIDEDLRQQLKMERDIKLRGYTPSEAKERIERRIPDATRYITPQKQHANISVRFYAKQPHSVGMDYHLSSMDMMVEKVNIPPPVEATVQSLVRYASMNAGYRSDSFRHLTINGNTSAIQTELARLAKQLQAQTGLERRAT